MNARNATMNVSCSRTLGLIVGGVAMVLALPAHALSLGGFQVKSTLDEPLKAEIQLSSADAATLKSLKVTLGSRQDFQRADVPRSEFLKQLKFTVSTEGKNPVIEVTTDQPVKEPFLHFLVSAEWSGGKLIREYTGLIDPPMYATGQPAAVESATTAPATKSKSPSMEVSSSTSGSGTTTGTTGEMAGESQTATGSSSSSGRSAEYGPTQKGDTLWAIASKLDTGSLQVNVFQVMIALLRQNPDAFIDNNINLLKTGQTLRLKDISAVAEVSVKEASAAYTAQLDEWQAYKTRIASAQGESSGQMASEETGSTETASVAPATKSQSTGGGMAKAAGASKKVSASEQAAATTSGESGQKGQDVLRIVQATVDKSQKSQSAGAGSDRSGEITELRGKINTLQEALDSRNLENKDLAERVRMLESQVKNAQRLVNIQDKELAAAQAQASSREAGGDSDATAEQVASQPVTAVKSATVADESTSAEDADQGAAASPAKPKVSKQPTVSKQKTGQNAGKNEQEAAITSVATTQAAAKQSSKPKQAAARVRKVVDTPVLTSLWNRIPDLLFSSWMWMVGAGAGVLVLVLGLLMFLRRRQSIAEFEESILSGSALDSYSETTDTAGTSASDTSFLSDFGTAGMGTMQADEVDPLAEAEVYLAYGRDEQAEDVLKEAARRDPDRSEIKLKLLEIYKQRNDVKSFETIAEELYPAGDQGDAEVWSKVTAMGREVNPNNPLFQESGAPGGAGTSGGGRATQPSAAATSRAPRPASAAGATALGLTGSEGASDTTSTPARRPTPTEPRELEAADLDLGLDETPPASPAASPAAHHDEDVLDFGDGFLGQASGNVDPATQPFPTPDQQTDLDQELERLAGERKAVAPDTPSTAGSDMDTDGTQTLSREVAWDKADADTSTLNFPSSDSSEIEFDLNLDESSIQQLSAGDTREGSKSTQQSTGGGRSSGNGEGLMEFESDNIPPEETWAGPSTDASPSSEDDAVPYTPSEDVHSSAAPQYNEADTKLDLARAYLDMGDKVGARSIIDEVMREGDPAQRDQAAELAAQL